MCNPGGGVPNQKMANLVFIATSLAIMHELESA